MSGDLVTLAKAMLKDPQYLADARQGSRFNNTIVGSILSIVHGQPRWATEEAVREALAAMKKRKR